MPRTIGSEINDASAAAFDAANRLRVLCDDHLGPGSGSRLLASVATRLEQEGHVLRSMANPGALGADAPQFPKSVLTDTVE